MIFALYLKLITFKKQNISIISRTERLALFVNQTCYNCPIDFMITQIKTRYDLEREATL